jgi:hypothetical protein
VISSLLLKQMGRFSSPKFTAGVTGTSVRIHADARGGGVPVPGKAHI